MSEPNDAHQEALRETDEMAKRLREKYDPELVAFTMANHGILTLRYTSTDTAESSLRILHECLVGCRVFMEPDPVKLLQTTAYCAISSLSMIEGNRSLDAMRDLRRCLTTLTGIEGN